MKKFDVIVIGCGITGLSSGFRLARSGLKVMCVDMMPIGLGTSSMALGYVSPPCEPYVQGNQELVQLAVKSLKMFAEFLLELQDTTSDKYDVNTKGYIHVAFSEEELPILDQMQTSWENAGLRIGRLKQTETLQVEPLISPSAYESLFMEEALGVNPREIIGGLVRAIDLLGGTVRDNVQVIGLISTSGKCEGVQLADEAIYADFVIVAAGSWSLNLLPEQIHPLIKPFKGQVVILKGPVENRLVCMVSTNNDVDIVPRRDGEILVGTSMEDRGFDINPTAKVSIEIMSRAFEVVPALAEYPIIGSRAGIRPCTSTRLPVIGPHPHHPNVIFATGHCQDGILLSPITSAIVSNLVSQTELSYPIDSFLPRLSE